MNEETSSGPWRPLWQFSIRALLLAMLLAATFLAGRGSMQPQFDRAHAEANQARRQAQQARWQYEHDRHLPVFEPTWDTDKGMQIDALEHNKRFRNIGIEALPQKH